MKNEIRLIKHSSHKAGAAAGAGVVLDNTNSSSSSTNPIADDAKEKLKPAKDSFISLDLTAKIAFNIYLSR